jgi:hypothetical protein
MNTNQQQVDFDALTRRARTLSIESLQWSAKDALEAAYMAEDLEKAGCRVSKSGGYYRDEATVYRTELRRREQKASK